MQALSAFPITLAQVANYASLFAAVAFVYLIVSHYDGSAIGTHRRPDLEAAPGGIPILGDLLLLLRRGDRQVELWQELRRNQVDKTKTMTLSLPFLRMIDGTNPSTIEHVQKTKFSRGTYGKGPLTAAIFAQSLGTGIFAVDGEQWLTIRKATSKIFSAANFRGIISHSIDDDLRTLEAILGQHATSGAAFDLAALFFRFTLSSFTKMAFSLDIGAMPLDTNAPPVPFAVAFDFSQGAMTRRLVNPFWQITDFFTTEGARMRAATKVLDDFAYDIIDRREAEGLHTIVGDQKSAEKDGKMDLLSLYMQLRDENGKPMAKKALRDSVLNLIIAGRDTTAQALSWIFFHLMLHPEMMQTLRTEVDTLEEVTYDNHKQLVQCLAVFNEGLRLHPSVPKNLWIAFEDDVLPNGVKVNKGEYVRWGDWEMGRSTEVWGPDAGEFKPSRWIKDGEIVKEGQFKAHWFNGGPRLCLGQNLATFEAVAVIATIVRSFDVSFADNYLAETEMVMIPGELSPRYEDSLTLPMKDPLKVKVTRRVQ